MSPKLAIITHEYYPVLSGGTVFTERLAVELHRLGWTVDVLTAKVGADAPKLERTADFEVRRFSTARRSVGDSTLGEHLSYFLLGLPQMLAHARARRYDLLFSVFAVPSGLLALFVSRALGIPSVVFVDAADTPGIGSAMQSYVRHLSSVFRLVTNASTGVVVLEGLEDLALPHINHQRVTTIPNGAVIPDKLARPGENGENLELLSIGRLVLRKGFQSILEALGKVREQRKDFRLRIVGYGRAEAEIQRALEQYGVSENVSFVGRVEYEKLEAYYTSSDVYLFYGDREGSSLAMIEAAAYGLPVVASDHPGNRTYVRHGESGFLVPHKEPGALSDTLLHLLSHRETLPGLGRRSRQLAESYSWQKVALRYDAFFRQALEERHAPNR